jgi:hypothetical protein
MEASAEYSRKGTSFCNKIQRQLHKLNFFSLLNIPAMKARRYRIDGEDVVGE